MKTVTCPYCKHQVSIANPKSGLTCCMDCNKNVAFTPFEPTPELVEDYDKGYDIYSENYDYYGSTD